MTAGRAPATSAGSATTSTGQGDQPELRFGQARQDGQGARGDEPVHAQDHQGADEEQGPGGIDLAPQRSADDRRRVQEVQTGGQQAAGRIGPAGHHGVEQHAEQEVERDGDPLDRGGQRLAVQEDAEGPEEGQEGGIDRACRAGRTRTGRTAARFSAQRLMTDTSPLWPGSGMTAMRMTRATRSRPPSTAHVRNRAEGFVTPDTAAHGTRHGRRRRPFHRVCRRYTLWVVTPLRAPRGTRDRLPEDAAAWARAEATATRPRDPLRLRADRDAAVRGHRAVRARPGGRLRRGGQGDVPGRRGRRQRGGGARPGPSAPSRPPASCAPTSSTGSTSAPARCGSSWSDRCSAMTDPRRAATASSPSGTSRSSAIRARPSTRSSSSWRPGTAPPSGWARRGSTSTRSATGSAGRPIGPRWSSTSAPTAIALSDDGRRRLEVEPAPGPGRPGA